MLAGIRTSDRRQESEELKPLSMGNADKEGTGMGVRNDSDVFEGELMSLQEKLTATTIENSEIRTLVHVWMQCNACGCRDFFHEARIGTVLPPTCTSWKML